MTAGTINSMTDEVDSSGPSRLRDLAFVTDAALRPALELAVGIAAAGQNLRPPIQYPQGLRPFIKPFLKHNRLDASALRSVRKVVVADESFRSRLGLVESGELIDELGSVWLLRPDGWEQRARALVREAREKVADDSAKAALKRSEKRREAAEQAAARALADLINHSDMLAGERLLREAAQARVLQAEARLDAAVDEVARLVRELERLSSKLDAESGRAERAESAGIDAGLRLRQVESARDELLARLHRTDETTAALPESISAVPPRRPKPPGDRRRPIPIPGGLYGDSAASAEHLFRVQSVRVIVDGYNVAKTAWPQLQLIEQRECCIKLLEDLVRRLATEIRVVFDGAEVVGASAGRRLVGVQFSPAGVTADAVICDAVRALPTSAPVVVVTNDQEIIVAVRAMGANVVATDTLLSLAGRTPLNR